MNRRLRALCLLVATSWIVSACSQTGERLSTSGPGRTGRMLTFGVIDSASQTSRQVLLSSRPSRGGTSPIPRTLSDTANPGSGSRSPIRTSIQLAPVAMRGPAVAAAIVILLALGIALLIPHRQTCPSGETLTTTGWNEAVEQSRVDIQVIIVGAGVILAAVIIAIGRVSSRSGSQGPHTEALTGRNP